MTATEEFSADRAVVLSSLTALRYGRRTTMDPAAKGRLGRFVECVHASAPNWNGDEGVDLCRIAGEVAELLSTDGSVASDQVRWLRLRAALLYELGRAPAVALTILEDADVPESILGFFRREGPFAELNGYGEVAVVPSSTEFSIEWSAVDWDVGRAAGYVQSLGARFEDLGATAMTGLARSLALPLFATDYQALEAVVRKRLETATRANVRDDLLEALRRTSFPSELWAAQTDALASGMLSDDVRSWGMSAPTGTGKSFLTEVLIADALLKQPQGLVLYLVPSKALVYEVSRRLGEALSSLDARVTAVTPALVDLDDEEEAAIAASSVLVLTPEKADLLVRLSAASFERTRLAIVDEAHHIESGTRGVLLEMYLWRLKGLLSPNARFVFLSAVSPNIEDLTEWIGRPSRTVVHRLRPTRMRVGVYRVGRVGRFRGGWIDYVAGGRLPLFDREVGTTKRGQLVQLAEALSVAGPVLIVAKGKKECENLARALAERVQASDQLSPDELRSDAIQRLDSRLERELYAEVPMRELLRSSVVYHHAGLPPRVRVAVEDAVRAGLVRYVFATTTLAEGVNFPFASVVVQSLSLRGPPVKGRPASYSPVTPRVFWNIAGRAGRPGTDREGQVILFEPSLGLDRIDYVLGDYLNPDLGSISPVTSALGAGLSGIVADLASGELDERWIDGIRIDERTPGRVQGTVNLIRVSLLHARATGLLTSPEEILDGTFAARFLDAETLREAEKIVEAQDRVVRNFFAGPTAPSEEVAAELGLSIETLDDLRTYARGLSNWQLDMMSNVLRGGEINENQIDYLVSPVAARMAELDGNKLGGFITALVRQWVLGVPFSDIRKDRTQRVEDLVSVVYSRIQYLLPWGLYAFDRLVDEEAARRGVAYNNEIRSVAFLVDAGVPGFDALRLTHAEVERVDAARLAARYRQLGGLRLGVDVVAWLAGLSAEDVRAVVSGPDSRRVDFDLPVVIGRLNAG
ncbi:MAG: DEAD/DEAH box helicase [Gammaproteobacteria bacterium]|nr:DEAD/DEAH box helicase [Gammaproteobacteria bacterium]